MKIGQLGVFFCFFSCCCVVKALALKIQLLATMNIAPKSGKEAIVVYL